MDRMSLLSHKETFGIGRFQDRNHTLARCDALGWEPSTTSIAEIGYCSFPCNAGPLKLHGQPSIIANFMRTLDLPKAVVHWSLTTLREKLVKIGAKVVHHGRYVTFQLAEVAVSRDLFRRILRLIDGLRPVPLPP